VNVFLELGGRNDSQIVHNLASQTALYKRIKSINQSKDQGDEKNQKYAASVVHKFCIERQEDLSLKIHSCPIETGGLVSED
jgi:hypothetical protein